MGMRDAIWRGPGTVSRLLIIIIMLQVFLQDPSPRTLAALGQYGCSITQKTEKDYKWQAQLLGQRMIRIQDQLGFQALISLTTLSRCFWMVPSCWKWCFNGVLSPQVISVLWNLAVNVVGMDGWICLFKKHQVWHVYKIRHVGWRMDGYIVTVGHL